MTATSNTLFGKKRQGATLNDLSAGDAFSETLIFAPGMAPENESEYLKAWPVGAEICGVLKSLRTTKPQEPGRKPQNYACLEAEDGQLFRVYTPGQLRYALENKAGIGAYVEMTYTGKEFVEKIGEDCHQFEVKSDKLILEDAKNH